MSEDGALRMLRESVSISPVRVIGHVAFAGLAAVGTLNIDASANIFSLSEAWAQAPHSKLCQPEDIVKARLSSQGQMRLIVGKRTTDEWNENVFTSDALGTKGYKLEYGSGKICISAEYRNIRVSDINDHRNTKSIPSWSLLNYDRRSAILDCKNTGGVCDPHNDSIKQAFSNGRYIMFMAISQRNNADGSLDDTGVLSVTSDKNGNSAVSYTSPMGGKELMATLVDTKTTSLFESLAAK